MLKTNNLINYSFIFLAICLFCSTSLVARETYIKARSAEKKAVMWEKVDISQQDLILGPGGNEMRPDVSKVTFLEEKKGGSSKKFEIKDANGREWVAKIDKESQPETASVRLVWALGYKTEINYLIPSLTIPGKGTFKNVRLEARPENIERMGRWKWEENPFSGSKEFKGLKIMMALLNNWDIKDGNTIILQKGDQLHYVVSDLGATFGKYGSNSFPIIWRFGRSINKPSDYSKSKFIRGIDDGEIEFAFKGKGDEIFEDISVGEARWVSDLLLQLSDKQIRDAFRAANYSQNDIDVLTSAVKKRISELDRVSTSSLAK